MATKHTLLVPVDFTDVTKNALSFAVDMAKTHQSNIFVLHLISHLSERTAAEQKLDQLVSEHSKGNSLEIEKRVVVGKVLTDIGIIADSMNIDLIIMGTHSTGVWDKVFGSRAMSVISNSDTPLILVQKETQFSTIKTVVMALDLIKESTQVARYAARIAKLFNSKIYLVAQKYSDELLMRKVTINLRIVNNYLKEDKLDVEVDLIDNPHFAHELLNFCEKVNADLLAATYYQETFHLFSANLVQKLAENPKSLPIMTLNGEETSQATAFGFITV